MTRFLIVALVLLTSLDAEARQRRVTYRIMKPKPPATTTVVPAVPTVRLIPIYCSDVSTTFTEIWCHRIERGMYRATFKP